MCTNVPSNCFEWNHSGTSFELVGFLVQCGQASLLYCIYTVALATQECYMPVLYPGLDCEFVAIYEIHNHEQECASVK